MHHLVRSVALIIVSGIALACAVEVTVARAPGDGLQPQAASDATGAVHLISFVGEPMGGDLDYRVRPPGQAGFSAPVRVNSVPASVIAMGTMRGAHLAIGRDGWVHVAWMGAKAATPKAPGGAAPMLYTRLAAGATAFAPQRNLITTASGLDGGGSLAADARGQVWVAWHAGPHTGGEAARALYVARSDDDGATFAPECAPVAEPTGACGCCGMRAGTDPSGAPLFAYRTATDDGAQRDLVLVALHADGAAGAPTTLGRWSTPSCPMSTCAMAPSTTAGAAMLVAWEEQAGLRWARVADGTPGPVITIAGAGAKHPSLAVAPDGTVLVAWTQGTGWNRGGSVCWRRFSAAGQPLDAIASRDDLPVWSLPTAVWAADGFHVWY